MLMLIFPSIFSQIVVKENFMGSGNLLGQLNSYTGTSWIKGADGSKPFTISTGSLSYPGYLASDVGNKVGFSSTGMDVAALPFQAAVTSGNIYVSFLVRISYVNPNSAGGYFFGLCSSGGLNYKSTIYAKKDGNNKVAFGIGIKTSANLWTDYVYDLNTTYLIVIKYQINSGDNNDLTSFIINPVLSETEPADSFWIKNTSVTGDIPIGAIFIHNGTSAACPGGYVGNIRVAKTWKDIIVDPEPSVTASPKYLSDFQSIASGGPSSETTFTASGLNLLENLQITPPEHYEISTTSGSGFTAVPLEIPHLYGAVAPTTVYVRLKAGLPVGSYMGEQIRISSGQASQSIICNGSVNRVISTSVPFLNDLSYDVGEGPSSEKSINIKGINLAEKMKLDLSPADHFEISTVSGGSFSSSAIQITPDDGSVNTTVYVRLKAGLPAGSYSCKLTVSSGDATPQKIFINGSSDDNQNTDKKNTVTLKMDTCNFSWTFDQPVAYGYFVDGQPWIVAPPEGVNMLSATPARIDGANVYIPDYTNNTQVPTVANINQTVVNPPVGTYYLPGHLDIYEIPAFGWDSRGAIRYEAPNRTSYNPALGWDGVTPKLLKAGDIVTTPQSITTPNIGETVLNATAVLTVLATPPPADAFRPGVVRSDERRLNPEFFTVSQIIDLTPYLIQKPTKTIIGNTISSTVPYAFSAERLTKLIPGPSIMNSGLIFSRSYKSRYNDSGYTYGEGIAQGLGDMAVGSLASWFTPEERRQTQIHFLQRAIDTYEAITAGCTLSGSGALRGYGSLLTIAGKMLDHAGMLSFNQQILGKDPVYYLYEFSQMLYVEKEGVNQPKTPEQGSMRRIQLSNVVGLMGYTAQFTSAENGKLVLKPDFDWKGGYRSARHAINLKLKIESGAGAGKEYYLITGVKDYYDEKGELTNYSGTEHIKGGTLTIQPNWQNGIPDSTSVIKMYEIVPAELPTWAYNGGSIDPSGKLTKSISLSPEESYMDLNAGALISYLCAMYAIGAEEYYRAGWDLWLLQILKQPGFGPYLLKKSNSRYLYADYDEETKFLSGLFRQYFMEKAGDMSEYSLETSVNALIPPASDEENLTTVYEKKLEDSNNKNFKLYLNRFQNILNFESEDEVKRIEVFSLTGQKLVSIPINSRQGTIDLNGISSQIVIVRAILNRSTESRKIILYMLH